MDNGQLRLPKIGDLAVRWSRALPAAPQRDGHPGRGGPLLRLVRRPGPEAPLPAVDAEVGIDLGLTHFAVLSDGTKVTARISAARKGAAPVAAGPGPKAAGSNNRKKARQGRPRARSGGRHPAGLAAPALDPHGPRQPSGVRRDLASPVSAGPGWPNRCTTRAGPRSSQCCSTRPPGTGATSSKIDRWFPRRRCSTCGRLDGPKPLNVRSWTCPVRGAHDRDVNASKYILGAGLALAAGGVGVRTGPTPAVDAEAGTALAGAA